MLSWPENRLREASVLRIATTVLAGALCLGPAWAAKVVQFTPQGIVSKIESVKLAFDSAVIAFGDGQAASPLDVVCNDPALKGRGRWLDAKRWTRSEEHTSELQSLMRISYAVICLKKKKHIQTIRNNTQSL